jgi:hypothetical protein
VLKKSLNSNEREIKKRMKMNFSRSTSRLFYSAVQSKKVEGKKSKSHLNKAQSGLSRSSSISPKATFSFHFQFRKEKFYISMEIFTFHIPVCWRRRFVVVEISFRMFSLLSFLQCVFEVKTVS